MTAEVQPAVAVEQLAVERPAVEQLPVWAVLAGAGTPVLDPARLAAAGLAPGERVVLVDGRPGSRIRLRAAARRHGLRVEYEYLLLPSASAPALACEDRPAAGRWLRAAV